MTQVPEKFENCDHNPQESTCPTCGECVLCICSCELDECILCGKKFMMGEDGNELGFCVECQEKPDFPYDLDKYYEDYDNGLVVFKGFETMSRGILEKYRKVK